MYTFDSRIRYSETDENAVLTIESLIDYFQDCSTFQTEDYGAGLSWLTEQKLAWVLNYWQIDIFRLPALYEHVRTGTVPYSIKGFVGLRNFFMDTLPGEGDPAGPERLAIANSVWSLMDMEKMMPARVTPEHASRYPLEEKLPMEYLDRKIRIPEQAAVFDASPVEVHHGHLDTNRHVNNGQYVRIALEVLAQVWDTVSDGLNDPASVERALERSVRVRAEYKQQAHLGDVLVPKVCVYGEEAANRAIAVDLMLNAKSCCVVEIASMSFGYTGGIFLPGDDS